MSLNYVVFELCPLPLYKTHILLVLFYWSLLQQLLLYRRPIWKVFWAKQHKNGLRVRAVTLMLVEMYILIVTAERSEANYCNIWA